MSRLRPSLRLASGLGLMLLALIFLVRADLGEPTRRFSTGGMPMTLMLPAPSPERLAALDDATPLYAPNGLPAVIVAHGFAGSSRIMLAYAQVLARAGYAVLLPDFPGHGDNPRTFDGDEQGLGEAVQAAYRVLLDQPEVDPTRIALVGHSMGSVAVISAALASPERYRATVAISPGRMPVTPLTPRNLQLQAGTAEPRFLRNAQHLLELGGGPSQDFANGRARELVRIPWAGHLMILFRDASHDAVVRWLDAALGHDSGGSVVHDRRILWWLVLLVGALIGLSSMAPVIQRNAKVEDRHRLIRRPLLWPALLLAPSVAALVCAALGRVIDLPRLGGLPIGGAMALWMLISGLIVAAVAFRPRPPRLRDLPTAAVAFVFLWLVFGLSAEFVWLSWGLVPARAWRWPLAAIACVPWFLAVEIGQGDPRGRGRAWWWLAQSASLTVGLLVFTWLVPALRFLGLILPLLPPILALLGIVGSRFNRPWAYGLAAGAFFGWLIAASFPLVG